MYLIKKITAPFPYTRGFVPEIFSTLKVCLIATLIFFFFKPFGLEQVTTSTIFGFGFAVFLSALFNISVSLGIVCFFINEERWCVWKEIIRVLIYLFINIIAIILFAIYKFEIILSSFTIFKFVGITIFLAIIPLSMRVVSVNNWLLKKKLKEAEHLSEILKDKKLKNASTPIQLKSNIINDIVETNNMDLQFIEADKNYIAITELKNGESKKKLLRLSIVKALEQIEDKNIVRCHRSYIVNLKAVTCVTGNSQGLKLVLSKNIKSIPVSRSYKKEITKKLSFLGS